MCHRVSSKCVRPFVLLLAFILSFRTAVGEESRKVLLVVGPSNHAPGTHEVAAGARLLAWCLENADGIGRFEAEVVEGWPTNPEQLQGVDSIVFSGDRFPIAELDNTEANMARLATMMADGCGIVCYHYATGLTKGQMPDDGSHPLLNWMGGYFATRCAHHQSTAKIFKKAKIEIGDQMHPVVRGVKSFTLHDEPYINNYFGPDGMAENVKPLLTSMLPPEAPRREVVAWATQRSDGGRGMAIVVPHFYRNWEVEDLRKIILNGVLWTAQEEVPEAGVTVDLPDLRRFNPESLVPIKR